MPRRDLRIAALEGALMRELPEVINWRRRDERITLSGQPTEIQLAQIKAIGVTHVINLGPHDNKGALEDEAASVAALGMTYIYIPVDFAAPTDADYVAFVAALESLGEVPVHLHCIYNARVSAFFYRLARSGKGDVTAAFELMDSIWRPGGVWARFIGDTASEALPNRYRGEEY